MSTSLSLALSYSSAYTLYHDTHSLYQTIRLRIYDGQHFDTEAPMSSDTTSIRYIRHYPSKNKETGPYAKTMSINELAVELQHYIWARTTW